MVAVRTNMASNPSFETYNTSTLQVAQPKASGATTASLITTGGGATALYSTEWSAEGSGGSLKVSGGTANSSAAYPYAFSGAAASMGVEPGKTYTVSATIRVPAVQTGTLDTRARTIAVGSVIGGVANYSFAFAVAAPNAIGTYRLKVTFTTPLVYENIFVRLMNGSMNTHVYWDQLVLEEGATDGSYFDGSTTADDTYTYSWTGAPHVSTSIAEYVPYYVEAEAVLEAGKPPRANITIHSIPGEQVLRLERTSGGETVIVPGARRKRSSGAAVIADPFPALGVPTTYTVWVGTQAMRQATLTVESATGWLQDPIYPDQAVPVVGRSGVAGALKLTNESLQSVTYPVTGTEHKVMGGQYGVVVGSGRAGAEGITLTHSSYDRELDAAVRDLVKETPVLVLRPPAGLQPLPPVSYLHAVFTDMPLTTHWGGNLARFSLAGNLVQAVLTAFRSGLATYEDVHAVLSGYTYAEVAAMQSGRSYLDVQKDPTAI